MVDRIAQFVRNTKPNMTTWTNHNYMQSHNPGFQRDLPALKVIFFLTMTHKENSTLYLFPTTKYVPGSKDYTWSRALDRNTEH